MDQHFRHSSFREKLIEHLFIGELLKRSWLDGHCALEIARPEVDNRGYDLVAEVGGIVRHIQLKASHTLAKAQRQNVHIALAAKPSGCVVWIQFDARTLVLGPFLFYGGRPGEALPDPSDFKVVRHTKANVQGIKNERVALRVIPKSRFQVLHTADAIYEALFECGAE